MLLVLLAAVPAAALTNPTFLVTDPADPGFGWETRGAISVADGAAVLQEDDRVLTHLAQTFTVPQGAGILRFTIVGANLTARDPLQPPDAFEVALLDASTSAPLVGTAVGLSNTDSFLNLQPNGELFFSPKVTVPGAVTSGQVASVQFPLTVEVDLRELAAGTQATLSFDLLGFSPLGSSVAIDNVMIRPLNQPPVAVPQGPATAQEGGKIAFSGAASSDPDNDPLTFAWTFGDGGSANGVSPIHSFTDNGTYSVRLTVTDPGGLTDSKALTVVVSNGAPDVDAGRDGSIVQGAAFASTGRFTDFGADIWTATVNYGDGSGAQPLALRPDKTFDLTHTYTAAGSFTVTVTVTDDDGGAGSDAALVTVQSRNRPPVAALQGPSTAREGEKVTFSGAGSSDPDNDPLTFAWTFGDGGSASGVNVIHPFVDNGTFTVLLKVTDPGGLTDSKALSVVVSNGAPAVDAGPDGSVAPGGTFTSTGRFTDFGADTWTALVDYGDGTGQQALTLRPDKTFELRHAYAKQGTFTVKVTVTDDDGGAGSDTLVVTVNRPPVCTAAKPSADRLGPPNHKLATIQVQGVTDADKDPVKIVVDRIRQDEPVNGTGDGDTAPDAEGVGTATVRVRSERAGTGNGRVYHIFFTATDGKGGACSGEVRVGVPHDQGQGSVLVDDGPLFDSTAVR